MRVNDGADEFAVAPGQGVPENGGESHEPPPLTALLPRFSAAQIAHQLGRKKRAVLGWFEDGCAHCVEYQGKRPIKMATMEDVRAYLRMRGLHETRISAVSVKSSGGGAAAGEGGAGREASAAGDVKASPAANEKGKEGTLFNEAFETAVDERLAEVLRLNADVDFDQMYTEARKAVEDVFKTKPKAEGSSAEQDRWASAMDKCTRSIRMLDEARHEQRMRAGKLIEKTLATKMLVSLSTLFVGSLDALASELVRSVMIQIESSIRPEAGAEVRRLITAGAKEAANSIRAKLAANLPTDKGIA